MKFQRKRSIETPIQIEIPVGGLPQHHRHSRQSEPPCTIPSCLTTSELKCTVYPSSVSCCQKCAMGYTLDNTVEVTRTCSKSTNSWSPCNFEECKPYVDCGVTLCYGGSQVCSTPTVTDPVSCRIKCETFEDNEACEEEEYKCDTNGQWSPSLPFCVTPGSGLQLVERPQGI
ncbi:uncharacterized protein TNIN_134571 [Trichonephila inaurata madagascariensis]|uniref:Sushi domain-containing protein n=1 Tax=Trichonephila inaurata madagascariensis TaxID=2747483 RepID=A0A8X6YD69_9ARAC|nr:uncharacterized protein TNIN_134571 [Trichonephila inaurata madagascariensis]